MGVQKAYIEDVCDILDSQRIPITASERKSGIYPYYGANGVQDYIDEYIFDDELVLLAEDGGNFNSKHKPIAYRVSGKCWVNNHAHVLRPKKMLNVDYLCYSLMFYDVSEIINGATRQKLNQSAVRKMQILLPPIEEQKKIADALDKASELIALRKAQIEKMDLLIKAKFIEMFGDPVTNSMGWETRNLLNLGKLERGKSKHRPRNDPKLLGGIYPLIQTGDVSNANLFINEYKSTYSELGLKQSKMWSAGTLCITIAANIAKTAILGFDACFPDSVVGIIPNKYMNIFFIHYWFAFFQEIIEKQAPESAQKNINLKILNELVVITPPIELQKQFADYVEQVEKQKELMQQGLEKLEMNYKALMQEYFS